MGSRLQNLPDRFPSLDGWRAVSILLVLGSHSTHTFDFPDSSRGVFEALFDGNLGVRFFFVISGFLITYLLVKEYAEVGRVSLRCFYARRALRILPVYFAFLAVIFALQMTTPMRLPSLAWIGNLTFTTNFAPRKYITTHLWSLAIEEQFYLVWPLVLSLSGFENTRRNILILCVPIVVAPICKALAYLRVLPPKLDWAFDDFSSLYYFDSIAIGCLAAVLLIKFHHEAGVLFLRFRGLAALVGSCMVLIPELVGQLCFPGIATIVQTPHTFAGVGFLLTAKIFQAVGFATLLVLSVLGPSSFQTLNWSISRKLGVLSYSIYIWHMPFSEDPGTFGLTHPWFMSFRYWLIPTLLLAGLSYYCLERPLLRLRFRLRMIPNKGVIKSQSAL